MSIEVKIPQIGESVTEVTLASWLVADGDQVDEGDNLCEIESDKANMELPAETAGVITFKASEGDELKIGAVIATIEPGAGTKKAAPKAEAPKAEAKASAPAASSSTGDKNFPSPAARKILDEKGVSADSVSGTGKDGRITKGDALGASQSKPAAASKPAADIKPAVAAGGAVRTKRVEKMTRLRKTIAARLTEAKNSTAMLTTFNEVDMFEVMELRKRYKEEFQKKHDIGLGFMSFFTKACCLALQQVPGVNAQLDGDDIIYHDYCDVGVAVSTPRGLVVPVVKNAESLSMAQIEGEIKRLALKGRDGKLTIDEMQGGTFTITNGGVFGSMLSTPILNIPQSAILGMHNIVERPVAYKGQVVIHPVMYLALSYDHRVIDGKESVTFLKTVKEMIEDPAKMLLGI
ncbi:MAG: dihydrolipoyllysine-residue succinyltransferase [Bdellovibrionales bacterium CG12_big_fil_rev_8_21_14_0_65_38_15]|nr:MAG: dihydrolipoyllysine-residue succinyltransferase [Bdellovibrionales bacterium CG22_combo_CG10-13_8_21_14_all_38_13]PIQ54069.1 MAG: dihydrolipoyllysine-residue succinyltransferase [Bdellovibrionales bacterium CG12_big_fil_rev_8_21_14_0_65_38_15]PIR28594.1 MAG: dihydrolipoyllysine-residue succinyltransferase [Bdellovibrionales bacterium CG11_big_fil_rev_8_21_14_0_20_38_13]